MSSKLQFIACIGQGNWAAAIKILDAEIKSSESTHQSPSAVPSLVFLLLNRGFCNQKLQLYRKALKVGDVDEDPLLQIPLPIATLKTHLRLPLRTMNKRCQPSLAASRRCTARARSSSS